MSNGLLISVVIPTFNRSRIVPRAIESVRRQTYKNLEILVVDDGSPDDTRKVVDAIADSRIRYIRHEKNKGLPAARNTGIQEAKGEFVAFLDDDDEWRKDKLEKQLIAIKNYDAVLCMAVAKGYPLRIHNSPVITLDDLRKGSFDPSSLLAKTSVLRSVLFDESLRHGEDWDAFIRIAQSYSIGWLAEPLLLYNQGDHERMTNEKMHMSGPELEKRASMLHKHRAFLGERWFRYHLADTLLGYFASRSDKLHCLSYAVNRCGMISVISVIIDKAVRKTRNNAWVLFHSRSMMSLSPQKQ
jgi:GalNAc5-diNAcBac-PP-undecaprenol beta-1,3-glucosyltransferase